jgi:hypothetical protein
MHLKIPATTKLLDISRNQLERLYLKKQLKFVTLGKQKLTTISWILDYLGDDPDVREIILSRYKALLKERGKLIN